LLETLLMALFVFLRIRNPQGIRDDKGFYDPRFVSQWLADWQDACKELME
jgi:hypothetical protein